MPSDDNTACRHPFRVQCPTCGNPVEWVEEQRWRPFCSQRCKLIDLGEWLKDDDNEENNSNGH